MEIFLERLFGPGVRRFVGHVRVLLVSRATVVFRSVGLPVAQTHPAKVVLTTVALHVVAPAVLLYADLTLGAHLYNRRLAFILRHTQLAPEFQMRKSTLVWADM